MRKRSKRLMSAMLTMAMTASLMTGCGDSSSSEETTKSTEGNTESAADSSTSSNYDEFLTIDVFASEANYEGIAKGWFADIVKEKFNMELNIIAPNVAGGGDTLFTTRSAAGELGDIVIISSENGRLADCVTAELLYDMSDMIEGSEVFEQYTAAIEKAQDLSGKDGVYAIPKMVSAQEATESSETVDLGFGAFIRWDYYQELGSPELNTLEDLLPLLKDMQEAHPTTDDGLPVYAMSLFKDWDGNMMNLAQQPARMYGYDESGFVLHKVDGSDYQSIIDDDSIYVRGLKFFFEANQLGIVDPESTTQNWDTLWNKYVAGQVLFSPWSWQGPSAFNTDENTSQNKGIKYVPIKDTEIISTGASPSGDKTVISIGSKAEDPQRMYDFIEWLYSPEGILANCSPDSGAAGPQGLTWDVVDGKSTLTEFGEKVFSNGDTEMIDGYSGTWRDGCSPLNFKAVLDTDTNPETNEPYAYNIWETYIEANENPVDASWSEAYGCLTMIELCEQQGTIVVANGNDYVSPEEDSSVTALRNQCKEKIVDYSWRMCFASSEEEFNSLLAELQSTVKGLGYDTVLEFDMQISKDQDAARLAAAE